MTDTTNTSTSAPSEMGGSGSVVSARRYRPRAGTVRERRVTPRFTEAELSTIRAAADAAQMTVTGFCALAVLAVARRRPGEPGRAGEARAGVEELSELQRELFAARTALNRAGVNLNQAVAALNSTGQPPVWLRHGADRIARVGAELDTVVARIHHRLR